MADVAFFACGQIPVCELLSTGCHVGPQEPRVGAGNLLVSGLGSASRLLTSRRRHGYRATRRGIVNDRLDLELIRDAGARLQRVVVRTPLIPLQDRETTGGKPILVKAESVQVSGSFKIRGASNFILQLAGAQRKRGVVAYSTGNHARAVALAGRRARVRAVIVMSPDAAEHKVDAVRLLGAEVVMADGSSEARRLLAEQLSRDQGLSLLPPYDDYAVLAGQGTVGLEIFEDTRPAAIFVPVGGAGLVTSIGVVARALSPVTRIIGVEPESEDDAFQSFASGDRVTLSEPSDSIADAVRVQTIGSLTWPLLHRYVDDIVTVSEREIAAATVALAAEHHLVVEPAGALGFAAALGYRGALRLGGPVVAVASGGNVRLTDFARFASVAEAK